MPSIYPVDSAGLYRWIAVAIILYEAAAYIVAYFRPIADGKDASDFMLSQLFNGVTFAGSAALVWGIMDPEILKLVGETTMFLLIAGLAGVFYSLRELFKPLKPAKKE